MLESIFGESGAVVAQFFVILIFVLILTGVCYWLFRRYYGHGGTGGARGRGPRLGVIDSISIDHRHRLVLVRRDNVEHLLLIGKSADLVVEPSIVRAAPTAGTRPRQGQEQRQPAPRPQQKPAAPSASPHQKPAAPSTPPPQPRAAPALPRPVAAPAPIPPVANPAAPQPAAPPVAPNRRPAPTSAAQQRQATGISEPIPFPQHRRSQNRPSQRIAETEPTNGPDHGDRIAGEAVQRQGGGVRAVTAAGPVAAAGVAATSASAHFEEPAHPTRVEPAFPTADAAEGTADESVPASTPQVPQYPQSGPTAATARPSSAAEAPRVAEARPVEVADAPDDEPTSPVAADNDPGPPPPAPTADETHADVKDKDRAATVSNLEQEMARLLGEITSRRDG